MAGFGISQRVVQLSEFLGMGLYLGVMPLITYTYAGSNTARMCRFISMTAYWC